MLTPKKWVWNTKEFLGLFFFLNARISQEVWAIFGKSIKESSDIFSVINLL